MQSLAFGALFGGARLRIRRDFCFVYLLGSILTAMPASGLGFDTETVTADWLFPDTATVLESHTVVVGAGVELPGSSIINGSFDIDLGPDFILFNFADPSGWQSEPANGWRFTDTNDSIPEIVGIAIDSLSPGISGLEPADLTFTADSVFANFGDSGISRVTTDGPGGFIRLSVQFVPEPSTAVLVGASLAGLALWRRRETRQRESRGV